MKRIGIIGYGNMGRMLLKGFLKQKKLKPEQVIVSTLEANGIEDLWQLVRQYDGIEVVEENRRLAEVCDVVIICVKPLEVIDVVGEIAPHMKPGAHLVSIAASVTQEHINHCLNGKKIPVTRVVPSLTAKVETGVTLVCHNSCVEPAQAATVAELFSGMGWVKVIHQDDFEVATNLTSTAPGLIAAIFREFVENGMRYSAFTREEVEEMVIHSFYGIAKLFYERHMKFPDTVSQVATRGGITEAGDEVIRRRLPPFFDELFQCTLNKFDQIQDEVSNRIIRVPVNNAAGNHR
jgi:pyrroline-5-carboxylate reductase